MRNFMPTQLYILDSVSKANCGRYVFRVGENKILIKEALQTSGD